MSKRGIIAGTAAVAVAALAIARGSTRRFEIRESSMAPVLEPGDWVIAHRITAIPERGDIVIFRDPTGSGLNLVKRVIGLPGEHVTISNGRVSIDGAILADRWAVGVTYPDGEWDVPERHIWVLGDNRGESRTDGRSIGTTPLEVVQWQVAARYWPRNRMGSVSQ